MINIAKFLGAVLLACATAGAAFAQNAAVSEQTLKAVLFFKLPMFVYHDDDERTDPTLHFCVLGTSLLDAALRNLAEQASGGPPVAFRNVPDESTTRSCDYLFIGKSEGGHLNATLRALDAGGIVTVSDIPGFARAGGMVELALRPDGSGLRILINRRAGRQAGIEFNAQLLRLAEIVEE